MHESVSHRELPNGKTSKSETPRVESSKDRQGPRAACRTTFFACRIVAFLWRCQPFHPPLHDVHLQRSSLLSKKQKNPISHPNRSFPPSHLALNKVPTPEPCTLAIHLMTANNQCAENFKLPLSSSCPYWPGFPLASGTEIMTWRITYCSSPQCKFFDFTQG